MRPTDFFRGFDRRERNPVLFAIVCWYVSATLSGGVALAGALFSGEPAARPCWGPVVVSAITLVLLPLLVWFVLYVLAFFFHGFVMIFVRPRKRYEETFDVVAYTRVFVTLTWISIAGPWSFFTASTSPWWA